MKALLLCGALLSAHQGAPSSSFEVASDETLSLLLKQIFSNAGYTVVVADTDVARLKSEKKITCEAHAKKLAKKMKLKGYNPEKLIKAFLEKNTDSAKLTLKSSPSDGYVIDYDKKFAHYFEGNGGGWEKLKRENPQAHGVTAISLPVVDQKNQVILIYIATQYDYLAGSGNLMAFKLEKGVVRELGRAMLWVS